MATKKETAAAQAVENAVETVEKTEAMAEAKAEEKAEAKAEEKAEAKAEEKDDRMVTIHLFKDDDRYAAPVFVGGSDYDRSGEFLSVCIPLSDKNVREPR